MIIRRPNPPRFTDYRRYKPLLREDFLYCCAYCGMHESVFGTVSHMTIDHFRPQSQFQRLLAVYGNLYYCCGECNTYKSDRWPTNSELIQNLRFFDACADERFDHFEHIDARITPKTNPGQFTIKCLRLDRPLLHERYAAIANRFSALVVDLARLQTIEERATELGGGMIDPVLSKELSALRQDFVYQLRQLVFPPPLLTLVQ